jgi:hypothetical protein
MAIVGEVRQAREARSQTSGSAAERVASLRAMAVEDPLAARDAAWAWFQRLGDLARSDRDEASAQLAGLFALGTPSVEIDGPSDGILVTPLIHPAADRIARVVTALWMPWMGKSFYRSEQRGDNRLTTAARWASKLLWPRYATRPAGDGRLAFDFETRVERGAAEPPVDVLVIDYAPVERNPRFVIRSIRDELVQLVPGAHLGRILWRHGDGHHTNIGYFALRTPAG